MNSSGKFIENFDGDEVGARKRTFIPGYSGFVHRMQETMAGTYAACSRDSHYLAYKGNHPAMAKASLSNPDEYYAKKPNPRFKTNCNNRSTFTFGDDRDWNFDTIHELHYRVPVKIPPRHESIMPGGVGANQCTKQELDRAYVDALNKVGVGGVKRLELSIRMKIEQRTAGGPMALRKAFKFFDTDASGDIDPDEFYAAMHAFGLEFTEDQVLALYGYYDVDRDGGLSYYEFIEKVMDSGFGNETGHEKMTISALPAEEEVLEMKSVLNVEDLNYDRTRRIFRKFDANNSGEIDMRELGILIKTLGLNMGADAINGAMIDLDKDKNGAISFEEFWSWFTSVSVIKHGNYSPTKTGALQLKQALHSVNDAANKELENKLGEDFDASRRGSPIRPSTAMSRPSTGNARTKMGAWMTREDKTESPSPHLAGRIRPQSAMTSSRPSTGSSLTASLNNKKPFSSQGWRSISRSDFRPMNTRLQPPRLNLPRRQGSRPTSAQPLLREPGAPHAPVGSTSGFRL